MEENTREKGSKTCFRTATKSFMRRNKAADRWLERKIWPLYLAVRKKLTAERESETKGGKQAQCPKQQLLWNKQHIRAKYPRTQKPKLVTSHFTSTTSPMTCKEYSYSLKGRGFIPKPNKKNCDSSYRQMRLEDAVVKPHCLTDSRLAETWKFLWVCWVWVAP